jgi:hypothetical protein
MTYVTPSLELEAIAAALESVCGASIQRVQQFDPATHTSVADVAVCVGPVKVCPLARKNVLFVLGQTRLHTPGDWDAVVVTSQKAKGLAFRQFGYRPLVRVARPPTTLLHLGRRRLVDEKRDWFHVSEGAVQVQDAVFMRVWGNFPNLMSNQIGQETLFNALEFNSLVKAGAVGFYPDSMEDGYDLQVARHLALGGPVVCRKDKDVLGPLADFCFDTFGDINVVPKNIVPVSSTATQEEYNSRISEVFHSLY